MSIKSMNEFFSNFCVFEAVDPHIQTDNKSYNTSIFSNENDARQHMRELNLRYMQELDNLEYERKIGKISLREYDEKFDKIIRTDRQLVRVCKFMSPQKQNSVCIKKSLNYFNNT